MNPFGFLPSSRQSRTSPYGAPANTGQRGTQQTSTGTDAPETGNASGGQGLGNPHAPTLAMPVADDPALRSHEWRTRLSAVNALAARHGVAGLPTLMRMVSDSDTDVARAALNGVRSLGSPRQAGMAMYLYRGDQTTRWEGLRQLASNPGLGAQRDEVVTITNNLLTSTDWRIRQRAVAAWETLQGANGATTLVRVASNDADADVMRDAVDGLRRVGTARQQGLAMYNQRHDHTLRTRGLELLAANPGRGAERDEIVTLVNNLLTSTDWRTRQRAVSAWETLQGANGAATLVRVASNESDADVMRTAVDALRRVGTARQQALAMYQQRHDAAMRTRGLDLLVLHPGAGAQHDEVVGLVSNLLRSNDWRTRQHAVRAWATLQGANGVAELQRMVRDNDTDVAGQARRELQNLGGNVPIPQARTHAVNVAPHTPTPALVARAGQSSSAPLAGPLNEDQVIEAFHNMLRDGLTRAVVEGGQITADDVESIETSVVIASPAPALIEAALKSDDGQINGRLNDGRAVTLDARTCPRNLQVLFTQFASVRTGIRGLSADQLRSLRAFVSNQESDDVSNDIRTLGSALVGLGIKISQRQTFKNLFAGDLARVTEGIASRETAVADLDNPEHAEVMEALRETLYAALAEGLETSSDLGTVLDTDPARGMLGAVAMSVVAAARISTDSTGLHLSIVSPTSPRCLEPASAPAVLQPLVGALLRLHAPLSQLSPERFEALRQLLVAGPVAAAPATDGLVLWLAREVNELAAAVLALPTFQRSAPQVFELLRALAA